MTRNNPAPIFARGDAVEQGGQGCPRSSWQRLSQTPTPPACFQLLGNSSAGCLFKASHHRKEARGDQGRRKEKEPSTIAVPSSPFWENQV